MGKLEVDLAEMGLGETEPLKPVLRLVAKPDGQWERCKGWIEAGLEGSPLTIGDVKDRLDAETAILWPGKASAIVSEFITYPSGLRAASVMSAGGELVELRSMIPGLEAFARLNGASEVIFDGRMGWKRALRDDGYELASIILRKTL